MKAPALQLISQIVQRNSAKQTASRQQQFSASNTNAEPKPPFAQIDRAMVARSRIDHAFEKQGAGKKQGRKVPASAFENSQLDLFQNFLCNTSDERGQLSNTIDLWDSIPRYSVSQQAMNKMRSPHGTLKLLKLDFQCAGNEWSVVIQPAKIEVEIIRYKSKQAGEPDKIVIQPARVGAKKIDGCETVEMDFYPSASEELVEDALRKIAADQKNGFFDKLNFRSGTIFTLHSLREELKRSGHSRSWQEIMLSLRILARSSIEILHGDDKERIAVSAYLPVLAGVTRRDLEIDPGAKWVVQFHPLVTASIDQLTYRQYNYLQMMSHKTQLGRWLHKYLALKYISASVTNTFVVHYKTIKRDSALLNAYLHNRQAVAALDAAFADLEAKKEIMSFDKTEVRGPRGKLEDVIYTLRPTAEFSKAMKAANKRLLLARKLPNNAPCSAVDNLSMKG